MKKIPTLFVREFNDDGSFKITHDITPGMEWVMQGEGEATIKYDGACCAFIDGIFYKRYDAKIGKDGKYKIPPQNSIPCCDPDPITGHWPHWVPVNYESPEDKWFVAALCGEEYENRTYEAVGPHFNGNPYNLKCDILIPHGIVLIYLERSFEGIKDCLYYNFLEGIVFWKDGEPQCKIKKTDFGFEWPIKRKGI